jgi:hypothetical protein
MACLRISGAQGEGADLLGKAWAPRELDEDDDYKEAAVEEEEAQSSL